MKKLKFTFILILLSSICLVSCDNEPLEGTFTDEIGTGDSNSNGSFSAKVNGAEYVENSLITTESGGLLLISAVKSDGSVLQISLPSDTVPGDYVISAAGSYLGQYSIAGDPIISTLANSGDLVILTHDTVAKTITGTFSFVATTPGTTTPEYSITEGTFDLSY